jgi:hypothetical protein
MHPAFDRYLGKFLSTYIFLSVLFTNIYPFVLSVGLCVMHVHDVSRELGARAAEGVRQLYLYNFIDTNLNI